MLPAVDDAVLQSNPAFASLYHTLTTAVLNPDASTKNDLLRKEREAVRETLKTHRKTHAKHNLLTHSIATATPPQPKAAKGTIGIRQPRQTQRPHAAAPTADIPDPLLDLMFLLPPLLDSLSASTSSSSSPLPSPLDPSSRALLFSNPPFSDLDTLLPTLAPLVSSTLHASATALARVAHPSTNPSFLHRLVSDLGGNDDDDDDDANRNRNNNSNRIGNSTPAAATVGPRTTASLTTAHLALLHSRTSLTNHTATLLAKHARAMALLIRSLEAKHGLVARSLELRAAETGSLARKGEIEARGAAAVVAGEVVYPADAVAALRNYAGHLVDAKGRVGESIRGLQRGLEGYGVFVSGGGGEEGGDGGDGTSRVVAKETRMREMAKVWNDMEREVEDVRRDLERLGQA